jgi:isopentenyl diphosphate isomerase/L-lactate dehydrogenase-like FMN-dependent dehydrogenase
LKALAPRPRVFMIGRPILWGLATSGADGVFDVLTILQRGLV